jgi:radical SAM-linked protein
VKLELRLAIRGRARFLSHLETVDMLLAAFRRAGYAVALSQGMRPKPVISLALARGVGVASEDECCTVELVADGIDSSELVDRLNATLPEGVIVHSAIPAPGRFVVTAVHYRVDFDASAADVAEAVAGYESATAIEIERRSPKRFRTLDVKRYAPKVRCDGSSVEFELAILEDGSAKPEEVARALGARTDRHLPVSAITRMETLVEPRAVRRGVTETV